MKARRRRGGAVLAAGAVAAALAGGAPASAAVVYRFDFERLQYYTGATRDPFSLTLSFDDFVVTTGMVALDGAPLPTTLGYAVAYAGAAAFGVWGFDDDGMAVLGDYNFVPNGDAFMFRPDAFAGDYVRSVGVWDGAVSGNAPGYFDGRARLTVTQTGVVPEPGSAWLATSALLALLAWPRRRATRTPPVEAG